MDGGWYGIMERRDMYLGHFSRSLTEDRQLHISNRFALDNVKCIIVYIVIDTEKV